MPDAPRDGAQARDGAASHDSGRRPMPPSTRAAGNGFGCELADAGSVPPALPMRSYQRRLREPAVAGCEKASAQATPREDARLTGFADDFAIPVGDMRAYAVFISDCCADGGSCRKVRHAAASKERDYAASTVARGGVSIERQLD